MTGAISISGRFMHVRLQEAGASRPAFFNLLRPPVSANVLAGFMTSTPFIAGHARPAVSRIVLIRLPRTAPASVGMGGYLEPSESLATELASAGVAIAFPAQFDRCIAAFLADAAGLFDKAVNDAYLQIVALLDQHDSVGRDCRKRWDIGATSLRTQPGAGIAGAAGEDRRERAIGVYRAVASGVDPGATALDADRSPCLSAADIAQSSALAECGPFVRSRHQKGAD